jgi:hypothetical protein
MADSFFCCFGKLLIEHCPFYQQLNGEDFFVKLEYNTKTPLRNAPPSPTKECTMPLRKTASCHHWLLEYNTLRYIHELIYRMLSVLVILTARSHSKFLSANYDYELCVLQPPLPKPHILCLIFSLTKPLIMCLMLLTDKTSILLFFPRIPTSVHMRAK